MLPLPSSLDESLLQLHEQQSVIDKQMLRIEQLEQKLGWFEEQFRLARAKHFGAKSERTVPEQESLFNEAEAVEEVAPATEEETTTISYQRKKPTGRRPLPNNLPVERIEYRLPEDEQVCSCCGCGMHEMSTQVRHELDYIPAKIRMLEHVRYIYGCRKCEREAIEVPIRTAPAPKPVIDKGMASASIVAHVLDKKFVEAVPLYRQEQQFRRQGIDLSRAVLSNWVIAASKWLEPLYNRMKEEMLKRDTLHADETTLQVLKEAGRTAESKSYMWLYRTGRAGPPIVLYEYQQTRAAEHPKEFLKGYKGYLNVDGYAGYADIEGATLVGCWAHARRKFDEVLKAMAQKHRKGSQAEQALAYINKLFSIERELAECSAEERLKGREEKSREVVEAFKVWLDGIKEKVLPKSLLGVAVTYCLRQWSKLIRYLEDGRLEISNNRAERSIKPFVIGRKNWLFANTPKGARASAIIYSVIETAKENGVNPYEYLKMLLEKLPNLPTLDGEHLEPLLPWNALIKSGQPC